MSRIRADQWRSVRWVLPYVKPYRIRLLLSALLLMIGTLLSLAFPWLMGRMLDSALNPGKSSWNMQHLALALGALLAVQAVLSFVRIRTMIEVAEKVLADARSAVFDHLLRMPMSFYMKHRVGELQSRLSSDLSQIQDAVSSTLTEWLRQVLVLVGLVGVHFLEPNPLFVNDFAVVGFGCRCFWSQNPTFSGEGSG